MKKNLGLDQKANCIAPISAFQAVVCRFLRFPGNRVPTRSQMSTSGNSNANSCRQTDRTSLVQNRDALKTVTARCLGVGAILTFGWCSSAAWAQPPEFLTGNDFQQQISRPLLVNWDLTPLQDVLNRLSQERHAAILLDRRIDPTQLIPVELQASYFDTGISELVRQFAGVAVVADTLFIAPPETAGTLLTRVVLSEQALESRLKQNLGRKLDLGDRHPVEWTLGDSPQQILDRIARHYQLRIVNLDAIPHDQWGPGQIRNPNAVEALLLIATQFQLDLEWIDGNQVRLVPQVLSPTIKREHALRNLTPQQALLRIRKQLPELQVTAIRGKVTVTGREEEQREVGVLLGNRPGRTASTDLTSVPLSRRRFTLKMQERPFLELLTVLEKQGIPVRRESIALEEAGIDLNTRISLELENATIERLFSDACRPLGLSFHIEEHQVELLAPGQSPPAVIPK